MPHVYSIITNSAFAPDTVKMMGEVFDQAWVALEPEYADRRDAEIELARLALAKAIILFAQLGNNDPDTLKRKALRIVTAPSPEGTASQVPSLQNSMTVSREERTNAKG
jgi:hypothetical protein